MPIDNNAEPINPILLNPETPKKVLSPPTQEIQLSSSEKIAILDADKKEIRQVEAQIDALDDNDPIQNDPVVVAQIKLDNYDQAKANYLKFKEERGIEEVETIVQTPILAWAGKGSQTVARISDDIQRRKTVERKLKNGEINLSNVNMEVEVMNREDLIKDPRMIKLWEIEENKPILASFASKELFQEVNATQWMKIEGITPEEFHAIIMGMGDNPAAIVSDNRNENKGRLVMDNKKEDMPIDEDDPRYNAEKKYWEPLTTNKLFPKAIQKWHMSRNHGVIYGVKDENGKDLLMLPIHIDPKNWVVSIKELFVKPEKGEKSALGFHQIAEAVKHYLGTGEYPLGIKQLIGMLRKKQLGLFGSLTVIGEEKLDTTGTISGDVERSRQVEMEFKKRNNIKD